MTTMIYVNLPVTNLARSVAFFTALGYSFESQFTSEDAACLIIDPDHIYVMMLTPEFFSRFTRKPVADATASSEVILALSADTRDDVDALTEKALAHGGTVSNDPDDQGYMYSRSFQDPDGHLWEVLYMDEAAMAEAMTLDGETSSDMD